MNEQALWSDFSRQPTKGNVDALFQLYQEWCEKEAKALFFSLRIRNVDIEDVLQYARTALLAAIHAFNVDLGYNFKNYARLRIKGEILNQLEHYSEEQTLIRTVGKASKLHSDTSSESDDLFNSILNIVINHTRDVLYYQHFHDLTNRQERIEWQSEKENMKEILDRALQKLSPVERKIMELSYYHSMSFTQVAESLSVSKSRVSQGYKSAINKLDQYFNERFRSYEFF